VICDASKVSSLLTKFTAVPLGGLRSDYLQLYFAGITHGPALARSSSTTLPTLRLT
jgi:hypothetical protein